MHTILNSIYPIYRVFTSEDQLSMKICLDDYAIESKNIKERTSKFLTYNHY